MSLNLPEVPTPNERVLAGFRVERFVPGSGTTITLAQPAQTGAVMCYKNGLALDTNGGASGFMISDKTVTLGTAAGVSDVYLVAYWPRTGGG